MKYFLVYKEDLDLISSGLEDCSLVIANDETSAISKYCSLNSHVKPKDFGKSLFCTYNIVEFFPIV